jgi:hypothetical protein
MYAARSQEDEVSHPMTKQACSIDPEASAAGQPYSNVIKVVECSLYLACGSALTLFFAGHFNLRRGKV